MSRPGTTNKIDSKAGITIQTDLTPKNLKEELTKIVDPELRKPILADYDELIKLLGNSGASKKVAHLIYKQLHAKH